MTAPTTIAECKRRSGLLTTIDKRCHSICIHGLFEKLLRIRLSGIKFKDKEHRLRAVQYSDGRVTGGVSHCCYAGKPDLVQIDL